MIAPLVVEPAYFPTTPPTAAPPAAPMIAPFWVLLRLEHPVVPAVSTAARARSVPVRVTVLCIAFIPRGSRGSQGSVHDESRRGARGVPGSGLSLQAPRYCPHGRTTDDYYCSIVGDGDFFSPGPVGN